MLSVAMEMPGPESLVTALKLMQQLFTTLQLWPPHMIGNNTINIPEIFQVFVVL